MVILQRSSKESKILTKMKKLIFVFFILFLGCKKENSLEILEIESRVDSTGNYGLSDLTIKYKTDFPITEEFIPNTAIIMPIETEVLKYPFLLINTDTLYGVRKKNNEINTYIFYIPGDHISHIYKEKYNSQIPNIALFIKYVCKRGVLKFKYNDKEISSNINKDVNFRFSLTEAYDDLE